MVKTPERCPGTWALGDSSWAGELDNMTPRGPFQPQLLGDSTQQDWIPHITTT